MDVVKSPHGLISKFNGKVSLSDPRTGSFKEHAGQIIVHQQGASCHQDGVELVPELTVDQCLEHSNGASCLVIVNFIHHGRR